MTSTPGSMPTPLPRHAAPRPESLRWFYAAAAVLMLVLTIAGFHHFYVEGRAYPGRPLTPPIRTWIVLHGASMAAWILLSIVQPVLIATRRHKLHMALGRAGAVLSAAIVVFGLVLATKAVAVAPPGLMFGPFTPKQFMVVPYTGAVTFGLCVAIGVAQRRKPDVHRPFMFLASLAAIPAALDRIDGIRDLYLHTVLYLTWGPFFGALVIGAVLLGLRCALARSFDRWFALGLAGLAAVSAVMMQVATSATWDRFATWMTT